MAANFQTRELLLGECTWGADRLDRQVVRELVAIKAPLALRDLPDGGQGWRLHYALFGRSGFTPAAREEAARHSALIVDAATLDRELA